jgi:nitrite reductase (NO-forming)
MIRARVGDSIDFYLRNPKSSQFPHNVDFHAVTGPGGGSVRLDTLPGSESHLKAKLLMPGVFIYHCAFPDIPSHLSHGMYGLVVVEPVKGLPRVNHEYYLMQSEFYTQKGGSLAYPNLTGQGRLAFDGQYANLEQPTFVVFNGRPEAIYGQRAIGVLGGPIRTGETVRLFVGDIGPNLPLELSHDRRDGLRRRVVRPGEHGRADDADPVWWSGRRRDEVRGPRRLPDR